MRSGDSFGDVRDTVGDVNEEDVDERSARPGRPCVLRAEVRHVLGRFAAIAFIL